MIHPLKLALVLVFSIPLVVFPQQAPGNAAHIRAQTTAAKAYFDKGEILIKGKDSQKAYSFFKKSLLQAKTDLDWNQYVTTLNKLASLYPSLNDQQKMEVFNWLKEAFNILKDDPINDEHVQLHFYVADFYSNLTYNVDTTLYHYEAALKGWVKLKGEWNAPVAACYHGMGDVYKFNKGDFTEAERCYEKALQIREKIHFSDEREMTRNYYGLATTNRSQRDFQKALAYGSKTLELSKKLNDIVYQEMTSNIVANIYRDMGESAMAKEYYQKAIVLNQKRNSPGDLASYYAGLGEISRNDSLLTEAIFYFQKAFNIYVRTDDKLRFTYLLSIMGETYRLNGDYEKSQKTFRRLLEELSLLNLMKGRQAYHAYAGLGDYHFSIQQNDSAIFYYQKAMATVISSFTSKEGNPKEELISPNYFIHGVLDKKAHVLNKMYSISKDLFYLKQSLDCLVLAEKLLSQERNTLDMEDSKRNFLESNYNVYEEIIETALEMSTLNPNDSSFQFVFRYFEQSKARSLADALIQTEQSHKIKDDDSLLRVHLDLKRKLFQVQDNLDNEIKKNPNGNIGILLRQEIVALDRDLQKTKLAIEQNYPGYFEIKYGNFIPPIQAIQKLLQSKNQIVLEYFWGNKSVYAFGISADKILLKKLGSVDQIETAENALMHYFASEHSSISTEFYNTFILNSHSLYKLLVEPFQPILINNSRIQIIPDGLISQVPFEVLLEKMHSNDHVDYRSLPYLIKKHSIGYSYSSALLTRNTIAAMRKPSLLGMGFTTNQQLPDTNSQFQELIGSELELKTLKARFNTGKFLEGYDATESSFKILSPDFDILHLAIHGKGEMDKNFSASLYFKTKSDSIEDGELHSYELYGIKLKAILAVLSACESGLGKNYKGEGMMSMASGFTYAGCENVLMSLWKVNDQVSISLMDNFYQYLGEGYSIDDALSKAKLNYIEQADELTADPRIWGPLVVYGKLNQIFIREERSRIYAITAIVILIILLLTLYLKKRLST